MLSECICQISAPSFVKNLEESARLQRAFANYFDLLVVDESYDQTYREVMDAWKALSVMDQWVPSTWVYS